LTFTFWLKKYSNPNASAFWADSPSSMQAMRGFQAHAPWSDGTVYFDSGGCCGANMSRINLAMSTDNFPDFTDASWWTTLWHHWAFVKNGTDKQIWVDGKLFLDGTGDPLHTDFARIWLGAIGGGPDVGPGSNLPGLMDDFAVFGTGLADTNIVKLSAGTLPTALDASTKLLAYWDFNAGGVVVPPTGPSLTATLSGASIVIAWPADATGYKLQSADALPATTWADVSGVTGNSFTVATPAGTKFYRLTKP